MKRERIRDYRAGDRVVTGRMNQLTRAARRDVVGEPPILVHAVGNSWQISHSSHDLDWFPAVIQSKSSDFTDHRYWVRPKDVANSASGLSDLLTWEDKGTVPGDLDVVVVNLGEYSDTHLLKNGDMVVVFLREDDSSPNVVRHFMAQPPKLCFHDDYYDWSDLSDVLIGGGNGTLSDLTGDMAGSSDTNFVVRGNMYKDSESDVNPWMAVGATEIGVITHFQYDTTAHEFQYKKTKIRVMSVGDSDAAWTSVTGLTECDDT